MRGILISHILLSQKLDPRRCKSYTLIKMCKCVEYFPIPNIFGTPLIMIFSLLINCLGSMGHISLFFFSILWNLHMFHFFLFFCYFESFTCLSFFSIAPYFFLAYENFGENYSWQMNGVFICWMEKSCFCVTLSVRVSIFICGCSWILIMGAWQESLQGSQ